MMKHPTPLPAERQAGSGRALAGPRLSAQRAGVGRAVELRSSGGSGGGSPLIAHHQGRLL